MSVSGSSEPEVFRENADTCDWSAYRAWEYRCKELGLDGPHRMASLVEWQYIDSSGTAAIYNAAKGVGHVFRR